MEITKIAVDMFNDGGDNILICPYSLYVFGGKIHLKYLADLFKEIQDQYRPAMIDRIRLNAHVYMDIWLDSDDDNFEEWYDYKVTEVVEY